MLILLPPSEGKSSPARGLALDLASLSFPALTPTREHLIEALVQLSSDPVRAARVLGVGPGIAVAAAENATLLRRPCAPAITVYSGVLYEALDFSTLDSRARRRARTQVAIASALWGLLRPADRIPAYRFSAGVALPGVAAAPWRRPIESTLAEIPGLVVDLRSGAYAAMARVPDVQRLASVRVLHEFDGRRTVVSHHNKATKGRLARYLLQADTVPRTVDELIVAVEQAGFTVEASTGPGGAMRIDVVVTRA
ncbi:MAG: peroxide stress protein YaaA [Actinomycetota bacterium]|nr:peroxide stress protein YaaA [Actinomycetota bacterium]